MTSWGVSCSYDPLKLVKAAAGAGSARPASCIESMQVYMHSSDSWEVVHPSLLHADELRYIAPNLSQDRAVPGMMYAYVNRPTMLYCIVVAGMKLES